MKQLLILSGKGGTGKTTLAGAFIQLSGAQRYADCDVDAPNLHLIMSQSAKPNRSDFFGLPKAEINQDKCVSCDLCRKNCRFGAVRVAVNYAIDPFSCEGCGVCEAVCPAGAVSLKPNVTGELMLYADPHTVFSTAQLKMGSGNSGKLVSEVKKNLKTAAPAGRLAIVDGSPGIGCPVIASLSGVNMVLIVAEPSVSGISDMERIIKTAKAFGVTVAVCINKYDTNFEATEKIKAYCHINQLHFVGMIPFDANAVIAINTGKSITEIDCAAGQAAKSVFEKTMQLLFNESVG